MIPRTFASWSALFALAVSFLCVAPAVAFAGEQVDGQSDPPIAGQQLASQAVGEMPATSGAQAPAVDQAASTATSGQGGSAADPQVSAQAEGEGAPALEAQAELTAQEAAPNVTLGVRAHVQNDGWQGWEKANSSGNTIYVGTEGRALRMEEVEFSLDGVSGGVQVQAHVQNIGWQEVGTGGGTHGKSLRVEAFRIMLTDEASQWYDVFYQAHVQNIGWQNEVSNGAIAGTHGQGLRVEALKIRLAKKASRTAPSDGIIGVRAQAHVQNDGWLSWAADGETVGTSGRALRMEALNLQVSPGIYGGTIECNAHVQNKGWMGYTAGYGGTSGQSLRMEAVQLRLTGGLADHFDVVYRAHVQNLGWQPWTLNGGVSGTCGRSLRIEAIQVKLVKKGSSLGLDEGTYFVTVAGDVEKNLANSNASSGSQTRIAIFNNDMPERYYLRNEGGGLISLQSVNSGLFLASSGGSVVQLSDEAASNHRWRLSAWDGGYTIANAAGGVMTASDGSAVVANGGVKWTFASTGLIPDGTYKVRNAAMGMGLDVADGSYDSGANVRVFSPNESGAQAYIFRNVGGSTYSIVNANSELAVEVGNASKVNGANVRQFKANGSAAQKWDASMNRAGGISFTNKGSGKMMTAEGSGGKGANVVSHDNSNSATQCWRLEASSFVGNPAIPRAHRAISGLWSSTNYAIVVDLTNHWLCIFKGSQYNWSLYKNWQVSNGRLDMPTVTGDYEVGIKGYSFGSGYTCYYYTQIWGDYLFHSAMYREGTFELMDGPLGVYSTHGCVRMDIDNAKWIYDNIPAGTKIRIYN